MGVHVLPEELAKEWSLSFADIEFVNAKPAATRLGLAAQLKFFAAYGFFATAAADIPDEAVTYLAEQLGVSNRDLLGYDFSGRSGRRHCAEILRHLGFRRMKRADRSALAEWIATELCPGGSRSARCSRTFFSGAGIAGFSDRRARRWSDWCARSGNASWIRFLALLRTAFARRRSRRWKHR